MGWEVDNFTLRLLIAMFTDLRKMGGGHSDVSSGQSLPNSNAEFSFINTTLNLQVYKVFTLSYSLSQNHIKLQRSTIWKISNSTTQRCKYLIIINHILYNILFIIIIFFFVMSVLLFVHFTPSIIHDKVDYLDKIILKTEIKIENYES